MIRERLHNIRCNGIIVINYNVFGLLNCFVFFYRDPAVYYVTA